MLQVSRGWCGLVAIPVIWFYTAATGWESSAIRASVMMTIVLGGWALKRPGDTVNSLAAAAFIILLWEPRQLFEASFQLSFFVVLIIALMLPPLNKMVDRLLRHDPLLPDELLPRWRRALTATLADAGALLRAFVRGVGRLHSARGEIFSPVQPGFDARQHRRRAARHAGADEQPRRARLRHVAAVGDGIVQPQRVVFHGGDDVGQRGCHQNSRRLFLRARAVVAGNRNLLRRAGRRVERLAFGAETKDLERGGVDSHRRRLCLALANRRATKSN